MQSKVFRSIQEILPAQWKTVASLNFPFSDHAFFKALETSGAVGIEAGWRPLYFTLWDDERLAAALVMYEKDHSYGEYIFDWEWARAYRTHGVPYYPKLVSAVPFTPATGPKLLLAPGADSECARRLLDAAIEFGEKAGHSSWHFLFTVPEETKFWERHGMLVRHTHQYHWRNRGYRDFGDFLAGLKARKAKQIVRERTQLGAEPVEIKRFTGAELSSEHAALMHRFYLSTIEKMGAIPYLNAAFFREVFATMAAEIVVWFAYRAGNPIAGAIHYFKGHALFGRYWGCSEEVRNLHFELCYYRGIEFAIERGFKLFEAGAQGSHKVARGFDPELTYSAHRFRHPAFQAAIGSFIEQEKASLAEGLADFAPHSPYRPGSLEQKP